jgi:hypothetical protein
VGGDVVYLEIADNISFTTTSTETLDAGEVTGDIVAMEQTTPLAAGTYYAKARLKRGAVFGPYSNIETKTISTSSYVGPGDVAGYGTAYAYWGLRAFSAAYATALSPIVTVCDNAGANPLIVNALANGNLDTAAITAWVAIDPGNRTLIKVSKLFDQSGNNRHLDHTYSDKPRLFLAGAGFGAPVLEVAPVIETTANAAALLQPFTVSQVMRTKAAFAANRDTFSNGNPIQIQIGSANTWLFYAGTVQNFTLNDTLWGACQFVFNGATSTANVSNLTNNPTGTPSAPVNAGSNNFDTSVPLGVGARTPNGGLDFDGYVFETIVVAGAVSAANQTTMINNQRAYGGNF